MTAALLPENVWLPSPHALEWEKCRRSPRYFVETYCHIHDPKSGEWIPFRMWPAQAAVLETVRTRDRVVALKARQLGFTWIVLGYILWLLVFKPGSFVLLFSKTDREAVELLDFRLRGMCRRLPAWLRPELDEDSKHEWLLANGSRVKVFPTSAGQSYSGTLAFVDEADKMQNFDQVLNAVKPTVDGGGKLVLLSSPEKSTPTSLFKTIYRKARARENTYAPVFHGWAARPDRTPEWYAAQKKDMREDDLFQEYPATEEEALAPRQEGKRILYAWLKGASALREPFSDEWLKENLPKLGFGPPPAVPGLRLYALPVRPTKDRHGRFVRGNLYVIGADPAEGNPNSDDSALEVIDYDTGEEVACVAGKINPQTLAQYADMIGRWYNDAAILCERNNHGHAFILWALEHSSLRLMGGKDGKSGWLSTATANAMLYDVTAESIRNAEVTVHDAQTFDQLGSIEGNTLEAPEGMRDDKADAFALAVLGRVRLGREEADFDALPVAGRAMPER